jgi:hypothetical protein
MSIVTLRLPDPGILKQNARFSVPAVPVRPFNDGEGRPNECMIHIWGKYSYIGIAAVVVGEPFGITHGG